MAPRAAAVCRRLCRRPVLDIKKEALAANCEGGVEGTTLLCTARGRRVNEAGLAPNSNEAPNSDEAPKSDEAGLAPNSNEAPTVMR